MKDHQAYNNKLFARWAPIYDGFELILSGVRDKITKEIDAQDKQVLDIATGTGSLALAISKTASHVTGIDLSQEMLDVARKKQHGNNVSFIQMDATQIDFPDNTFDTVTISLGLHDMPPEVRSAVLLETKRVLKENCKLYVLEYDLPKNQMIAAITRNLINSFESKYYMAFLKTDISEFIESFGFQLQKKENYLFKHLQFLQLISKN